MGGEVSDSQDCSIVDSHPFQISKLIATEGNLLPAPAVSPLPSEKKKQHRNPLPTPVVAENLEEDNLSCPLQPIEEKKQEKKEGRFLKGRQIDKMLEKREVFLALPQLQKGSPFLRDRLMQNERSCRQLRCWSGDLPDFNRTVCDSTQLLTLSRQNQDKPLRIYQRRNRCQKAKAETTVQDELPRTPKVLSYNTRQEKTPDPALTKEEFALPNHKDNFRV